MSITKNPRGNGGDSDAKLANVASAGTPYAAPVKSIQYKSRAHLQEELDEVDANGGKGLMPGSLYEEGKRSLTLLRVKTIHDEEAQVMNHDHLEGEKLRALGSAHTGNTRRAAVFLRNGFDRQRPGQAPDNLVVGYLPLHRTNGQQLPSLSQNEQI